MNGQLRSRVRQWTSNPRIVPYIFISPFLVLFAVFMVYPVFRSLILSFFSFRGLQSRTFVGLQNYVALFGETRFLNALYNTSYFAVMMIVLTMIVSFPLSLVLSSDRFPGAKFFRLVYFVPILTSLIVAGAVFKLIFLDSEAGLLNTILGFVGAKPKNWLLNDFWAINAVLIMAFWRRMGLNVMYFVAGLQSLPEDLYESARIDGANGVQMLRYVTFPLMRPIISFVVIITLIYAFLAFDEVFVLNPAGAMDSPQDNMVTLGFYLYESGFQRFKFGYGSAVGFMMTAIILAFSVLQLKLLGVLKTDE